MGSLAAMEFVDNTLKLIDQRQLPNKFSFFVCKTWQDCEYAIKDMVVRGAPAIGAAAAYGAVLAAMQYKNHSGVDFVNLMHNAMASLSKARPTAVNLNWAINRMLNVFDSLDWTKLEEAGNILKQEADSLHNEDIEKSKKLSLFGADLIADGARILTHCNTGSLAVPGPGTALGMIKAAYDCGKKLSVFADETRPRLQGARLTAWELLTEGIPCTLIADSVASCLMRDGKVDLVVVGADRIAANGDTANKIGTFALSLAAAHFRIPFYVAAPLSTIDPGCATGNQIKIEERPSTEVTMLDGIKLAPDGINVYNPAFDVSPAENISAIITEKGILRPPFSESIANVLGKNK